MQHPGDHLTYRPEIDGLRAIAILTVVFYHVGLGCPGGYIGVDVFFVISGYLISSLILRDLRAGTFSLAGFWERRIRRIFPALAACVLATLVAAWFLLLPDDLANLGKSAVAQALLCANFYFWRTTNYFGGANEEKQLLHTWSLAVEEQFYLLFPLLLLALFRFPALRRPRTLVTLVLFGLAASLSIAAWGVKHQPYATFFLLPTRAWELLCGVLVAALPAAAFPTSRLTRESASWIGLAAILVPVWAYGETTPFPGLAALSPCLGTALVIWGTGRRSEVGGQRSGGAATCLSDHSSNGQQTTDNRQLFSTTLLSSRPLVFIGLISYSLYLWHWPLIAFCSYWKIAPFSPLVRWILVGISLILAVLSWRYVETPFRRKRLCGNRRSSFLFLTGVSTLSVLMAGCFVLLHGCPNRIPASGQSVLRTIKENASVRGKYSTIARNIDNLSVVQNDSLHRFGSIEPYAPLSFVVLGDSHAWCAIPVFDQLGRKYGISGTSITYQSTPPLLGWKHHSRFGAKESERLWQAALDYVRRNKISNTFLVAYWSDYGKQGRSNDLQVSLEETIKAFQTTGSKVWVLLDAPSFDVAVSKAQVRDMIFPQFAPSISPPNEAEHKKRNSALYALCSSASGASFLDPSPFLLDSKTGIFRFAQGGVPLYSDSHHLTVLGAEVALAPVIEQAFLTIAKSNKP